MRKTATTILAVGLLTAAFASTATAGSLLSETFAPYPNGPLSLGTSPCSFWCTYSGTWSALNDIQVVSGQASGTGDNGPDDHIALASPRLATDRTYMCFDVVIPAPAGAPKAVYFAELKDAGSTLLVARTYVLPLTAGGWTFGVSHTSTSTTVGITPWGTALNYGQTYRVVVAYDGTAKTSTLWVDPVDESSPSVTDTNAGSTSVAVTHFGLRQSGTASAFPANPTFGSGSVNWAFLVDNVSVGTTFADACGGITPTLPSTWGRLKTIYRN